MDMSQYLDLFLSEARENLRKLGERIVELEKEPSDREAVDALFRHAHSIKGMAASMDFGVAAEVAHRMEDLMDRVRKNTFPFDAGAADLMIEGADLLERILADIEGGNGGTLGTGDLIDRLCAYHGKPAAPEPAPAATEQAASPAAEERVAVESATVRVKTAFLDRLVNTVGELLTVRHRLHDIMQEGEVPRLPETVAEMTRLLRDLHNGVMQARMMPLHTVTDNFPKIVRDIARKRGKKASLEIEGREIELDRGVLERLGDPLLHILRNAVDHGIEATATRLKQGKPETGTIIVAAHREKDDVVVSVTDDGKGMDPATLVSAAVARKVVTPEKAALLSPREIFMLTCIPGFSTAEEVTDVSGRGVGMDAVLSSVRGFGGTLAIDSEAGQGTSIRLVIPRSVAIVNVLLAGCGDLVVGIPASRVQRLIETREAREDDITMISLDRLLGLPPLPDSPYHPVVVMEGKGRTIGLVAERLSGHQEVFLKPLGKPLSALKGLTAGAVLGDGSPLFVIEPAAL